MCQSDKKCANHLVTQIVAIVTLKAAFDGSVQGARGALAECDSWCPIGHYTRGVGDSAVNLKGHPIVCDSCTKVYSRSPGPRK